MHEGLELCGGGLVVRGKVSSGRGGCMGSCEVIWGGRWDS